MSTPTSEYRVHAAREARPAHPRSAPPVVRRWRVVDIVVASVIGVAGGVIFWAWDLVWHTRAAALERCCPACRGSSRRLAVRRRARRADHPQARRRPLHRARRGRRVDARSAPSGASRPSIWGIVAGPRRRDRASRCSSTRSGGSARPCSPVPARDSPSALHRHELRLGTPRYAAAFKIDLHRELRRLGRRARRLLSWLAARGLARDGRAQPVRLGPRGRRPGLTRALASDRIARHGTAGVARPRARLGLAARRPPTPGRLASSTSTSRRASACCCSAPPARASRRLLAGLAGVLGGDEEGDERRRAPRRRRARRRATAGASGLVLQDPGLAGRPGARRRRRGVRLREPRRAARRDLAARAGAPSTPSGSTCRSTTPTSALSRRAEAAPRARRRARHAAGPAAARRADGEPRSGGRRRGARRRGPRRRRRTGATLVVVEHRVAVWLPVVDRVVVLGAGGGVLADGDPTTCSARRARPLAEAGVWVPGRRAVLARPRPRSRRRVTAARRRRASPSARGPRPRRRRPASTSTSPRGGAGRHRPERRGQVDARAHARRAAPPVAGALAATPSLSPTAPARPRSAGGRASCSPGSARSSRTRSTSSSPATVRDELAVGPRGAAARPRPRSPTRRRAARAAAARPPRRREPVHAVGRREAPALGRPRCSRRGPRMLVLDEPTFGQDARTWRELVALLAELLDEGTRRRRRHPRRRVRRRARRRRARARRPGSSRRAHDVRR